MLQDFTMNTEMTILWLFRLPAFLWKRCGVLLTQVFGWNLALEDPNRDIYQGLVYLAIMIFYYTLRGTPYTMYSTFVIK